MDKTWWVAGLGAAIVAVSGVSTILVDSIAIKEEMEVIFNGHSTQDAYDLIHDLHSSISSSDREVIRFMSSAYVNGVDFYGRTSSINYVVEDKRKLFQRWPNRDYYFVPIHEETDCKGSRCIVVGVTHFNVSNESGLSKSGSNKYKYTPHFPSKALISLS
ncbi:hypothetical protein [Donghicola eburneus]|uniref:hypothetical protein n=1 Tax=Donghicola eburneus TaxID=393278 RepID=UPI0008E7673A|nr:hypothetical protein [Donghicola eburneus]SFQ66230.1 hypothetical protein SAMN05421764_1091 [Donghicola eburneus]